MGRARRPGALLLLVVLGRSVVGLEGGVQSELLRVLADNAASRRRGSGARGPCAGCPLQTRSPPLGRLCCSRAIAPCGLLPGWGTRVGHAFVYGSRHWARAAPRSPRPLRLLRVPCAPGEVGARCQVTPPLLAPVSDAPGEKMPTQRAPLHLESPRSMLTAFGTLTQPRSLPFSHLLQASPPCSGSEQGDTELAFACCVEGRARGEHGPIHAGSLSSCAVRQPGRSPRLPRDGPTSGRTLGAGGQTV